jgi:sugar lactone lactonase YvrE
MKKIMIASTVLAAAVLGLSCGDTVLIQGDSPGIIRTVAGGGEGRAVEGSNVLDVKITRPAQVIGGETGNYIVLETSAHRILFVGPAGIVERIAGGGTGGGTEGFAGDGEEESKALFRSPQGFCLDRQGALYIADTFNHRIRKIDTDGIVSTVAGSDSAGFSGDGGPATEARLYKPADVTVDPLGRVIFSDQGNNRIRMVDTDGTIQTICGTGGFSFNGDGIPAMDANVFIPSGIDSDDQGGIYVAVTGHHMVRRIEVSGMIRTVAGSGVPAFGGDGGPAVGGSLNSPTDVFLMPDGAFYIADQRNQRVRFVDSAGAISTVAGNGETGYNGDGLFATEAWLNFPTGVGMDRFNNLYIADRDNFRIRRIPFPGPAEGDDDSGPSAPGNPVGLERR